MLPGTAELQVSYSLSYQDAIYACLRVIALIDYCRENLHEQIELTFNGD